MELQTSITALFQPMKSFQLYNFLIRNQKRDAPPSLHIIGRLQSPINRRGNCYFIYDMEIHSELYWNIKGFLYFSLRVCFFPY